MNCKMIGKDSKREVGELFRSVFTSSEGEMEGGLVGNLALELSSKIDNKTIFCFAAYEDDLIIGSVFLTQLYFNSPIKIYMLAPVAVTEKYQGKGVGKSLINYALKDLKDRGVSVVVTYGDPAFYSKVGFKPLSEKVIKAPLKLSMPEGWLGQSLTKELIPVIDNKPKCVNEFDNPAYW